MNEVETMLAETSGREREGRHSSASMKSGRAKAEDAAELDEVLLSTYAALGLTPSTTQSQV